MEARKNEKMFFPRFDSVTIKEWQVVLSSVEDTLSTGFFVLPPNITQENPTRKNFFWPFRQAVVCKANGGVGGR